jgi:hypothetical protein
MSILKSTNFDRNKDNIAVFVKEFTLLKSSESIFDIYNEPYIIGLSFDEKGFIDKGIHTSIQSFPNMRKGRTIHFGAQGHLIYGPSNPGSFLVYHILFMENDDDVRELGAILEDVVKSGEVKDLLNTLATVVNPTVGIASLMLQKVVEILGNTLKKDKNDFLHHIEGTLLRDVKRPYDIGLSYTDTGNDYINATISILPVNEISDYQEEPIKLSFA